MTRPIYLDHNATTPVDPRVLEAMLPYFTEAFGNASSIDHEYGVEAARAVDTARQQVASLIGARPAEIVFTSGATESDNLAIIGVAEQYKDKGRHIITCVTEHKAVLDTCRYLEGRGWEVTYLPVDQYGLVTSEQVDEAIRDDTALVSIMMANNEIGTLAPIAEIGCVTRERGVLFHTDAAQAVGHIPVDVEALGVDLLSLSGHKFYGPKGVGALFVRSRRPRVKIAPALHGGGHERGMRPGTINVPSVVGLGCAAQIAPIEIADEGKRLARIRDQVWEMVRARLDGVQLNGHPELRLPHNLSIAIPEIESRSLIVNLSSSVALSSGSACTTAVVEPSHVILALGFPQERAHSTIRIGLGRMTSAADAERAAEAVIAAAERIRSIR